MFISIQLGLGVGCSGILVRITLDCVAYRMLTPDVPDLQRIIAAPIVTNDRAQVAKYPMQMAVFQYFLAAM